MKEQLGHASIQITVDTYGHLIPGANRGAVDRLDDAWTPSDATQAQPQPECTPEALAELQELLGNVVSQAGSKSASVHDRLSTADPFLESRLRPFTVHPLGAP